MVTTSLKLICFKNNCRIEGIIATKLRSHQSLVSCTLSYHIHDSISVTAESRVVSVSSSPQKVSNFLIAIWHENGYVWHAIYIFICQTTRARNTGVRYDLSADHMNGNLLIIISVNGTIWVNRKYFGFINFIDIMSLDVVLANRLSHVQLN